MADNLPVASGGSAVTVASGGSAVTVSNQVGDLSVDRGRGARTAAGADAQRQETITGLSQATGLNASQLKAASEWMRGPNGQELLYRELQARDAGERASVTTLLQKEWKGDYSANVARIQHYLAGLPQDFAAEVMHARDATGGAICNKASFMRALLQAARMQEGLERAYLNQVHGRAEQDSRAQELAELNAKMADRNSEYWKGPNAEANQARWRELHDQGVAAAVAPTAEGAVKQRIAELEKLVAKTDSAYWRGPNAEALQREYRDLLDRRNAGEK